LQASQSSNSRARLASKGTLPRTGGIPRTHHAPALWGAFDAPVTSMSQLTADTAGRSNVGRRLVRAGRRAIRYLTSSKEEEYRDPRIELARGATDWGLRAHVLAVESSYNQSKFCCRYNAEIGLWYRARCSAVCRATPCHPTTADSVAVPTDFTTHRRSRSLDERRNVQHSERRLAAGLGFARPCSGS
jgi:hypothetical protein